ncbi:FxSxx-COOH system tetratricopeptide repeat protein [Solwaraspora sp. WMMB762]|uniref:FxSxx-COOH system tetratricopeptide repeat protein n=1 Tax=Solwaraspora sp. WMMB762 TaxID=3404120 RepID=UPI003B9565ED
MTDTPTTTAASKTGTGRQTAEVLVFVSPGGGAGQTSIVANIAWILASTGHRVLILDWGGNAPRVQDYLHPFLDVTTSVDEPLGAALRMIADRTETTPETRVQRFQAAGWADAVDVVTASSDSFYPAALPDGAGDGSQLRRLLQQTSYHYVLLDAPPQNPQSALHQLACLCDAAAVCFRSHQRVQQDALRLAGALVNAAPVGLRLVATPTQVRPGEPHVAERLHAARQQFAQLAGPASAGVTVSFVEVPRHSYDIEREALAIILDRGSLRAGLTSVVHAMTDGAVLSAPDVGRRLRMRYERALGFDPQAEPEKVYLAYRPADRRWADWITDRLRQQGLPASRLPADDSWIEQSTPPSLVVIGGLATADGRVRRIAERLRDAVLSPTEVSDQVSDVSDPVVQVAVTAQTPADFDATVPCLDLVGLSAGDAEARLRRHFLLIETPYDDGAGFRPRYPGGPPEHRQLPPAVDLPGRNQQFTGRADDLETLRDRLLADGPGPVLVVGATGVGKSELANEYAHRFHKDYDIVWWIPADSWESIALALRRLNEQFQLLDPNPSEVDTEGVEEQPRQAFDHLLQLAARRPCLFIFDGLDDRELLEWVGSAAGHVVVTSRITDTPAPRLLVVTHLGTDDATELLRTYVPELSEEHCAAVVAQVGQLPLSLRLSGAWLRESRHHLMAYAPADLEAATEAMVASLRPESLAGLPTDANSSPAGSVPDDDPTYHALRRSWRALEATLRQTEIGRIAIHLAEMCSFLSTDDISLTLLRSSSMIDQLATLSDDGGERVRNDPAIFDGVVWTGARFGVFDVRWGQRPSIRIHRAVQDAVRDALPPDRAAEVRRHLRLGLASYAPTGAEVDGGWQRHRLAELQPHLLPSGAVAETDPKVRRWVVRQVRYMRRQETWDSANVALKVIDEALGHWSSAVPPTDRIHMQLRGEQASLLRWMGRYRESLEIAQQLRLLQLHTIGQEHPNTATTLQGIAGDVRALGEFELAKSHEGVAYDILRKAYGEEHQQTLMVAHNLALSSYFDGDLYTAMVVEREVVNRRLRVFGTRDPFLWWAAANLATYQRELGDYQAATRTIDDARGWLGHPTGKIPTDSASALRIIRVLAVTQRRKNMVPQAKENHADALRGYQQLRGTNHLDTLACKLALATDMHLLRETPARVVEFGQSCYRGYQRQLGPEHPLTGICLVNLALFLRGVGDLDESRRIGDHGLRIIRTAVPAETHPWVLAATINQAGNLGHGGAVDAAMRLAGQAVELCEEDLPPGHPYPDIARANLRVWEQAARRSAGTGPTNPISTHDLDIDIPRR